MKDYVIFHHRMRREVRDVLRHYSDEANDVLADRFYDAFQRTVERALSNPRHYHFVSDPVRRANIPRFPYHFLYRETSYGIRVLILRHHKKHPSVGMRRR